MSFRAARNSKFVSTIGLVLGIGSTVPALALPADFVGSYRILQSRTLGLTAGGLGYVLQDGSLISEGAVDLSRAYCRSAQTKFDESFGAIQVSFQTAVDGSEHALLKTVPGTPTAKPTDIECISFAGFGGALDLSIALGRIVELAR